MIMWSVTGSQLVLCFKKAGFQPLFDTYRDKSICRVSASGLILHEQEKSGFFQPLPQFLLEFRAWQLKLKSCRILGENWM